MDSLTDSNYIIHGCDQDTKESMCFYLAPCKTKIANLLYDKDPPCNCCQCMVDPRGLRVECAAELTTPHSTPEAQPIEQAKPSVRKRVPAAEVITKEPRAFRISEIAKPDFL